MTDQPAADREPAVPEATPDTEPAPPPDVEADGTIETAVAAEAGVAAETGAVVEADAPDGPPAAEPAGTAADAEPVGAGAAGAGGSPSRGPRLLGYLGAAVLGIAIGAGGLALAGGSLGASSPSPSADPSPSPTTQPADNAVGSPDAPVTMEVWADYQCPYCRLEDVLFGGAVEREYAAPGIVQVLYRDFAFLGQESADAAVAARCAGRLESAARLRYHDALYTFQQGENEGRFVRENLVQVAEIVGISDTAAFTACLDDPEVAAAVAAETQAGREAGISSTPTIQLRGPGGERVLTGFSQTWATLRDAIEAVRVPAPTPGPSGSPAGSPEPSSPSPAP
jgi:protein-disulfide isomerase